ncbi:MAG: CHAD domain-containing protein [Acidimicrobiales bacterium]
MLIGTGATGVTLPKLARVLGSGALAGSEIPDPGHVGPKDPALAVIQASLCEQVRALMIWDLRVRGDAPDAVHQLRVTVRRLRSEVRSFSPLLDPAWADVTSRELGWLAHELGPARELEVLLDDLSRAITRLPAGFDSDAVGQVIERHYKSQLAEAIGRARSALAADRYVALVDSLVLATRSPPGAPQADVKSRRALPPLVWETWKALRRRVERISVQNPADSDYHRARIAAKRCRYSAEACVRVFGSPASHFAGAVKEIHDVLGSHQDAVVAAAAVQALAAQGDVGAPMAFGLGLLYADQRDRAARTRGEFHDRWPAVAHRATSGWPRKAAR